MVKLVLLFKSASKSGDFERRFGRNLDLLKTMPGVQRIEVNKVLGSPTGQAPYHRIVELFFEDMAALDQALTSPEGVTAGKDLMGFAAQQVELLFVEVSDAAATPPPLTPDNLQAYLDSHDIPAEIIYPGQPTPTVEKAAEALGVEPDQIVKSVLFLVDNKPFLVFACGTRRVDFQKLADRLNVSKKKVKLAAPEQVLDLTGFAVGTVPPLGLKTPMPAYLDPSVQAHEVIYAGGGGDNAMLKITSADLLKISDAEIAPMLQDETPPKDKASPGSENTESASESGESDESDES